MIGVLATAEQIDLQRAGEVVYFGALPGVERLNLVEARKSSMPRNIQRERPRAIVFIRHRHADGLHRAVEWRAETAHYAPFLGRPRRLSRLQLFSPFQSLIEHG